VANGERWGVRGEERSSDHGRAERPWPRENGGFSLEPRARGVLTSGQKEFLSKPVGWPAVQNVWRQRSRTFWTRGHAGVRWKGSTLHNGPIMRCWAGPARPVDCPYQPASADQEACIPCHSQNPFVRVGGIPARSRTARQQSSGAGRCSHHQ